MNDLNYVGLMKCYICGNDKGVVLDRRLKNSLPHSAVYDKEPCDKCKEYMKQGIILIGIRDGETDTNNPYRTGEFIVIKKEVIPKIMNSPELIKAILKSRICFVEQSVLERTGIKGLIKNES